MSKEWEVYMTPTKFSPSKFSVAYYLNVVEKHVEPRAGCLTSQLYQYLNANGRPTYSSFYQRIKGVKGLRFTPALAGNSAEFVSTKHGVSTKRKWLNILVSEWELKNKMEAKWFLDINHLHTVYEEMARRIIYKGTDESAKEIFDNRKIKFNETAKWLKTYTTSRTEMLKDRREAMAESKIEIYEFNNEGDLALVEREKKISKPNPFTKPNVSLLNLFYRGIFLSIEDVPDPVDGGSDIAFRFRYFDIENDLTITALRSDVAMIFEFMAVNDLKIPFKIICYTWDERKAKIYKDNFLVSKLDITEKTIVKHSLKDTLYKVGVYYGIEYESLNISRYFVPRSQAY